MSLSLRPTARVYVCLIGDGGRKLIPGSELQAGDNDADLPRPALRNPLGNNAVELIVDGTARTVPPSSERDRLLDHEGVRPGARLPPEPAAARCT